jgi:hypothetical protein
MTKRRKPPTSPQEQLANVYESLANDAFEIPSKASEEAKRESSRVFRAAIEKAVASEHIAGTPSRDESQQEWTQRTAQNVPYIKGPRK